MMVRSIALFLTCLAIPVFSADVPCAWEESCNNWTTRGDANLDGNLDVSDGIYILNFLFDAGSAPACMRIADMQGGGQVDVSDAIYLFAHLFDGGPRPKQTFVISVSACSCENDASLPGEGDPCEGGARLRGDVNGDGFIDFSDIIWLGNWFDGGGQPPRCLEAVDFDFNGIIEPAIDAEKWNQYLNFGGPGPCKNFLGCPDDPANGCL